MRVLGIDYGRTRIGLALSDEDAVLASPLPPYASRRKDEAKIEHLARLIEREGVGRVVVGLPLHMNGSAGEMADEVTAFAEQLSARAGVPVDLLDERQTTAEANRILHEARVPQKRRKHLRDGIAAVQILQCYLDRAESGA